MQLNKIRVVAWWNEASIENKMNGDKNLYMYLTYILSQKIKNLREKLNLDMILQAYSNWKVYQTQLDIVFYHQFYKQQYFSLAVHFIPHYNMILTSKIRYMYELLFI